MSATTSTSFGHSTSSTLLPAPLRRLVATTSELSPALARIAIALVMFPHGAQKALGWFGGYGWSGTYGFMTAKMGIPGPLAALAIVTELLAPIALVVGLGSRLAALGIAAIMLVAIATVHLPFGFFMNWTGAQAGEGFEYHILMLALAAIVVIRGGGKASLDRKLG